MRTPLELSSVFRLQRRKMTPQRIAVFEAMYDSDSHPTAESVYDAALASIGSISRRTVYQTLGELCDMHEIQVVDVGVGARRFDRNTDDHQHLICDVCEDIADVYLDTSGVWPDDLEGFQANGATVVIHGTCATCAKTDTDAG